MFGVIFFWTPPHTWALAMKFQEDYARAGVPMLPVVATAAAGDAADRHLLLDHRRLHPRCSLPVTSWIYVAVAALSGVWFVVFAHRLHNVVRRGGSTNPMKFFHMSNLYLMLVFCGLAVDAVVGLPVLGWPF